jgi:ubiquinone/menaquinone biosynthesis C-methylase UbiE
MISLARTAERAERLGVEYVLSDVEELDQEERFDLVVAAFLLNYASSEAHLLRMCRVIADHLKPGCRFVTVNSNPAMGSRLVDYRKYGFERLVASELLNGSQYVFRNYQGDTSFDITVVHLDVATHEQAFASAGLTHVRWVRPEVSRAGNRIFGAEYWETFVRDPPIVLIECHAKGSTSSTLGQLRRWPRCLRR